MLQPLQNQWVVEAQRESLTVFGQSFGQMSETNGRGDVRVVLAILVGIQRRDCVFRRTVHRDKDSPSLCYTVRWGAGTMKEKADAGNRGSFSGSGPGMRIVCVLSHSPGDAAMGRDHY